MEELLCNLFREDKHRGMLITGQGMLLQHRWSIRELTEMGLQFNKGWLSVTTVKRKDILLDRAYLDMEQLAFLADNGDTITPAQASQKILTPAAFQTDDLDAFDSDCDDAPSAKAVLMANLSSYDSDAL
ncbi:hypothetical protein Tco_1074043 [Tanacetum coccineum]